jgi:hypothetical protein
MIQRFPFRAFAAALIAAGGAPMALKWWLPPRGRMRRKACIGKTHFLSARFTHYRLQSFGNLCDMN